MNYRSHKYDRKSDNLYINFSGKLCYQSPITSYFSIGQDYYGNYASITIWRFSRHTDNVETLIDSLELNMEDNEYAIHQVKKYTAKLSK